MRRGPTALLPRALVRRRSRFTGHVAWPVARRRIGKADPAPMPAPGKAGHRVKSGVMSNATASCTANRPVSLASNRARAVTCERTKRTILLLPAGATGLEAS